MESLLVEKSKEKYHRTTAILNE